MNPLPFAPSPPPYPHSTTPTALPPSNAATLTSWPQSMAQSLLASCNENGWTAESSAWYFPKGIMMAGIGGGGGGISFEGNRMVIQILQAYGSVFGTALNCAVLVLIDAGVAMTGLLVACTCVVVEEWD
ncbi:hypothetical protein ACHAW6_003566 [Cyclotella cf. meneghiniana]